MKERIQVYADSETKRRIELAAIQNNMPVTEYCLTAIKVQLDEDDLLREAQVTISVLAPQKGDLIDQLRALHQRFHDTPRKEPIDLDAILEQVRAERDDELSSLP